MLKRLLHGLLFALRKQDFDDGEQPLHKRQILESLLLKRDRRLMLDEMCLDCPRWQEMNLLIPQIGVCL